MTTPTTKPMVNPIEAVVQGFRKYANFSGRATRAEYWWWVLFTFIGSAVFAVIDSIADWNGPLNTLFSLAILLPTVTVITRRLHDIGKTGWWQLGWYAINITAWLVAGIMYFIALVITYGTTDASGKYSFHITEVEWANTGAAYAAFPAAAIVVVAAGIITLALFIMAIVWLVRQGESVENRFGPDPRTSDAPDSQ